MNEDAAMTIKYGYAPLFVDDRTPAIVRERKADASESAIDRAPPNYYVFNDDILLRINVALATGRPLLVRGPSGCGKSSLARAIASRADWNFMERTIDSRTQAQDLLYQIDQLKRLQDSQHAGLNPDESVYVKPGPFFWAFDAERCRKLLENTGRSGAVPEAVQYEKPWVLLIDEIDKAEPDVPNNLLTPLGSLMFFAPELALTVKADPKRLPLVMITTNEERELPPAFLRRCVELEIGVPDAARLEKIAGVHKLGKGVDLAALAKAYIDAPRPAGQHCNSAEYLDFVRTWQELAPGADEATRNAVLEAICGRAAR